MIFSKVPNPSSFYLMEIIFPWMKLGINFKQLLTNFDLYLDFITCQNIISVAIRVSITLDQTLFDVHHHLAFPGKSVPFPRIVQDEFNSSNISLSFCNCIFTFSAKKIKIISAFFTINLQSLPKMKTGLRGYKSKAEGHRFESFVWTYTNSII